MSLLTLDFNMATAFDASRVWSYTISIRMLVFGSAPVAIWIGHVTYCLGAVVLTWTHISKAASTCSNSRYLESHGIRVRVLQPQYLGHFSIERPCLFVSGSPVRPDR
jgi:hypothetical protein